MKNLLILFIVLFQFTLSAQSTLNMQQLGDFDWTTDEWSDIWGYVDEDGNEYAITGTEDSIYFIDVTECSNPVLKFRHNSYTQIWRDFKVYEDYAYAVCDGGGCVDGLRIYDMTALPAGNVTYVSGITTWFTRAHNIYVDESSDRLYACDVFQPGIGKTDIVILDISIPTSPSLLYKGALGSGYLHDLNVKNDTIWGSYFLGDELRVFDATDPTNITLIEAVSGMDGAHAHWNDAEQEWGYLIEEKANHTINVIDLANLNDPNNDMSITGQIWDPLGTGSGLIAHNLFVLNDYLYMSHYEDGVKIYDISTRNNPVVAAYNDIYPENGNTYSGFEGTWGIYPFLPSGCILATDITHGLNTMQMDWTIADTCTPIIDITSTVIPGLYSASNHLTSSVMSSPFAGTIFQAEMSVNLEIGFESRAGFEFEAKIAPCVSNN